MRLVCNCATSPRADCHLAWNIGHHHVARGRRDSVGAHVTARRLVVARVASRPGHHACQRCWSHCSHNLAHGCYDPVDPESSDNPDSRGGLMARDTLRNPRNQCSCQSFWRFALAGWPDPRSVAALALAAAPLAAKMLDLGSAESPVSMIPPGHCACPPAYQRAGIFLQV